MNDRLTLRLGDLSGPLIAHCAARDISPSEFCRSAIADALGVAPPDMPQGFAAIPPDVADAIRRLPRKRRKRS